MGGPSPEGLHSANNNLEKPGGHLSTGPKAFPGHLRELARWSLRAMDDKGDLPPRWAWVPSCCISLSLRSSCYVSALSCLLWTPGCLTPGGTAVMCVPSGMQRTRSVSRPDSRWAPWQDGLQPPPAPPWTWFCTWKGRVSCRDGPRESVLTCNLSTCPAADTGEEVERKSSFYFVLLRKISTRLQRRPGRAAQAPNMCTLTTASSSVSV